MKGKSHSSKISLILAILSLLVSAAQSAGENARTAPYHASSVPKKVIAVIRCDYPPTNFLDNRTGKPTGFFVDVMDKVAERAGLQVYYMCDNSWPSIIDKVERGEADLSGMIISEERKKDLLFTTPIDISYISFFVRSQSSIDADRLPEGITVGLLKKSATYDKLKDRPNISFVQNDNLQEALFALLAGKIDLFAGPESIILELARESGLEGRIKKVGKPLDEAKRCIAVRKDNVALLELLNRTIGGFVGGPEYQQIYMKWYGKPIPYWTTKRIVTVGGIFLFITVGGMALWRYLTIIKLNKELRQNIAERKRAEQTLRETEERFRKIFENGPLGMAMVGLDLRYKKVNDRMCQLVGYSEEELTTKSVCDITYPDDAGKDTEQAEQLLKRKILFFSIEKRYLSKSGGILWVNLTVSLLSSETNEPLYFITMVEDITKRKRAEKALVESEKFLQTIIETEPECVKLLDANGRVLQMNRAGLSMIEADCLEQIKGQSVYTLVTEEYRGAFKSLTEDVFGGESGTLEFEAIGLKGAHIWFETHAVPLRNDKDEIVALLGITRDVTEHKRIVGQLKKDHENFLRIFSAAPVGLLLLNRETVITRANEAIRGMVVREPAEVIGMRAGGGLGCIHSLEDPRGCGFSMSCPDCNLRRGIENVIAEGSKMHGVLINLKLLVSGIPQQRWLSISAEPYQFDGQPNVIVAVDDYTDRKHTEEALIISEKKFKSLFNSINDAILILDLPGHIVEANNVACDRLGYNKEELLRMKPADLDTPEYTDLVSQRINKIQKDGELIFETAQMKRDGTVIPTEINCRIVEYEGRPAMLSICRDITDRKHAEKQIRQSLREKETLLREIHHRVKNNMAVVSSLLALQANAIKDPNIKHLFEESQQRVKSISLVHEKLCGTKDLSSINFKDHINSIIQEIMALYHIDDNLITMVLNIEDIEFDLESAVPCGLIINELLTNAFKYAFPDNRRGVLSVYFTRAENTYALTIKDNGVGLPEGFDYKETTTLGFQLVDVLAKQLMGTLQLISDGGTEALVTFTIGNKDGKEENTDS